MRPPSGADRHVVKPNGGVRSRFRLCFTGGGYNCVTDGDTAKAELSLERRRVNWVPAGALVKRDRAT
jgi:hypothetical protein